LVFSIRMKQIHIKYLFGALIALLFMLCIYRAMHLSMTHDESGTYLFWHDQSVFPFLYDTSVWTSANNHLLNTFLFQISEQILGFSDFSIRLPNVLSWLLYGFCCFSLSQIAFRSISAQIVFLSLSILNPYIFDFFSLCRGYGLSLAFMSAAMLTFATFLKNRKSSYLMLAFGCLLLSSLAILSNAILIPAFAISIILINIYSYGMVRSKASITISIFSLFLSALVLYTPIKALSQNGELAYGNQQLFNSWTTLIQDSLMGKAYVGEHSFSIFAWLIMVVLFGSIIILLRKYILENKRENFSQIPVFFASSFLFLVLGLILSHMILGSEYPINRKSIFIVPMVAVLLGSAVDIVSSSIKSTAVGIGILFLSALHFINTINIDYTREWWYESHTEQYIYTIQQAHQNEEITIGCHWLFHPTLYYYTQTSDWDHIDLQPYQKDLDTTTYYDYFISTGQEVNQLNEKYKMLERSATDAILWRRK